jgi:hypothetical protein
VGKILTNRQSKTNALNRLIEPTLGLNERVENAIELFG